MLKNVIPASIGGGRKSGLDEFQILKKKYGERIPKGHLTNKKIYLYLELVQTRGRGSRQTAESAVPIRIFYRENSVPDSRGEKRSERGWKMRS